MAIIAALLALAMTVVGCVTPAGAELEACGPGWEPVIVEGPTAVTGATRTIPIECYVVTGERQLEVGFIMPPGPDCFAVAFVEVIEDAEAVSLELRIGAFNNPLGGACPEEALPWNTLVELNQPVEGRRILDAARLPS